MANTQRCEAEGESPPTPWNVLGIQMEGFVCQYLRSLKDPKTSGLV